MEEKVKEIIAPFLKIPIDQFNHNTPIDRSAIGNSILLHRMYAKVIEAGFKVNDYWQIKNFGELLKNINGITVVDNHLSVSSAHPVESVENSFVNIGIDLEESSNLPRVSDFREDTFYQDNFTSEEIAYCSLQSDPYASFTGLFAAKEAIVKANNSFLNKPFNVIQIKHTLSGKPSHDNFHLSISHTSNHAIAIAISIQNPVSQPVNISEPLIYIPERKTNSTFLIWTMILSLLLSITAITFLILENYN